MHGKKNLKVRDRASSCISIFQCLLKWSFESQSRPNRKECFLLFPTQGITLAPDLCFYSWKQDRDEAERKKIIAVEKAAEIEKLQALENSHRPEWTNPGNLPNYLPTRQKGDLKTHSGMSLRERDALEKQRIEELEELAQQELEAELEESHRPEWTNPGMLPNYLERDDDDLDRYKHTGKTMKQRDAEEKAKLEAAKAAELARQFNMKSGKSDRPEFTAPGSMPNYLAKNRKSTELKFHKGKTMAQRNAQEKQRLDAFKEKLQADHVEEMKKGKAKSGKSYRPEFINAANMPNYLRSASAATGRTARKKGQEIAKLFETLDLDGDGELTREEVVSSAEHINMTSKEAEQFFDSLDTANKGFLSKEEWENRAQGLEKFVHAGKTMEVKYKIRSETHSKGFHVLLCLLRSVCKCDCVRHVIPLR